MKHSVDTHFFKGELELPEGSQVDTLLPNYQKTTLAGEDVGKRLNEPTGGPALSDFLTDKERILIILNDGQRPTPSKMVLEQIMPRLYTKETKIIIACGTHREPNMAEKRKILGDYLDDFCDELHYNRSKEDDFNPYGETSRGTRVRFNKLLNWADGIIPVGSVEPHYFAGLTGGRKSFLPGVAAYSTIEANHSLATKDGSATFALEGNPVHEDMMEAVSLLDLDRIFSIQTVVDSGSNPCFMSCGDLISSFDEAGKRAMQIYGVTIPFKYDLVIAGVSAPLNKTLYQSQKGLENASLARRTGGRIVLSSLCTEGVGDDVFVELLKEGKTPKGALELIENEFKLGYQKAAKIARHALEGELFLHSGIQEGVVKSIFATPVFDLAQCTRGLEGPQRVLIIPNAPMTVPLLA
ncbi:MAG TPA: nickel-dependent lactate racemase [Euryarchaeota archaeon]|nr:nickel-dependent lactate racemase [Euryarchaeota archaeon]